MFEGRAGRRILRQSEQFQRHLVESAHPSVLDADRLARQHLEDGFVVIPAGTTVLMDAFVPGSRGRRPKLGEYRLATDTHCEIYDWGRSRLNLNMPEGSSTVSLGQDSFKKRSLDVEYDAAGKRISSLYQHHGTACYLPEIATAEILQTAVADEISAEIARLAQEFLKNNLELRKRISKTRLNPRAIGELVFDVAASSYLEIPNL